MQAHLMKVITEMCCAGTPDEGYYRCCAGTPDKVITEMCCAQKCVVQAHLMKVIRCACTEMCCAGTPDEGYYRNVLCRHT